MPSIIKSLSLKNFKGFSEEVRIELRPVTLLFGQNSAGKSSLLHALQYFREILERGNANADHTMQGGKAVDLGGFLNLVHGRDPQRRIEIEIEMQLGNTSIPEILPDAFEDWHEDDQSVWRMYEALQTVRRKVRTVSVRLSVGWNEQREQPIVLGYQIKANEEWCLRIEASGDGRDARMQINQCNPIFMEESAETDMHLLDLGDFVAPIDLGITDDPVTHPAQSATPGKTMRSVLNDLFLSVQAAGIERPGDGLRAWMTGFRGAMPRLDEMLYIPAPDAVGAENVYIVREFTAFLSWLTIGPAMLLRDQLRQLRYIGPLRTIPPRRLDVSLTKSESAWSDGMAGWETLLTGSQDLVERVSDWMESPEKLGIGYSVMRKPYQEFDTSQPVPTPIGPVRRRLNLVDAAGMTHQPQDVGVGISQVLPVVVSAQDGSASVVCIEQPELHIHPRVQVGLGDLFIDGALNHDVSFLIETHSEHLILRLLRRIREAGELPGGANGQTVTPEMVGVYCLTRQNGTVVVNEIPVTHNGEFDTPWPHGFFDERGAELF
ncbi:AAA family ATPase [Pseudomonas canadensis]|uniref:AAA family ATPase n=1 Tax=Pseudomonas canadensis TaxID=915099 RepID=UPI003B9F65E7